MKPADAFPSLWEHTSFNPEPAATTSSTEQSTVVAGSGLSDGELVGVITGKRLFFDRFAGLSSVE
jgi:hypothetical protein